ncbi:MAG: hypothetical protein FJX76_16555 [Armatimonadetes bacterium]|nr:hypothetical protein [Armatimonadota bacterium]
MVRRIGALIVLLACTVATMAAPESARASNPGEGTFVKTLSRAPGAGRDWRTVLDRYGRFKLNIPVEWTEYPPEQYGDNYNLVVGENSARDGFTANFNVIFLEVPSDYKLTESMVSSLAKETLKSAQQYHYVVKDKAFTKLGGIPCVVLGGTLNVQGRHLRNLQIRIVHRQMNYLFTFTTLDKSYAQYEPLFARFARSLVFEREDGTWPSPPLASPSPSPKPSPNPSSAASPAPTVTPSPSPSPQPD